MKDPYVQARRAYQFLRTSEQAKRTFPSRVILVEAICKETDYSPETAKAYIKKRWAAFCHRGNDGTYSIQGIEECGEEAFVQLHCQIHFPSPKQVAEQIPVPLSLKTLWRDQKKIFQQVTRLVASWLL